MGDIGDGVRDDFLKIFEENNILFSESAMAGDPIEVLAPLVSLADKIKDNKSQYKLNFKTKKNNK